jgi:hypothetical protein
MGQQYVRRQTEVVSREISRSGENSYVRRLPAHRPALAPGTAWRPAAAAGPAGGDEAAAGQAAAVIAGVREVQEAALMLGQEGNGSCAGILPASDLMQAGCLRSIGKPTAG